MKTFLKDQTICLTFTCFLADIPIHRGGHSVYYKVFFSVSSDIMSGENVGHGVQNIGHVRRLFIFTVHSQQIVALPWCHWTLPQ